MGLLGPWELLILGALAVVVLGRRRLPALGRASRSALDGLRKESTGRDDGQLERIVDERRPRGED